MAIFALVIPASYHYQWRASLIALQEHFSIETAAVLLTLEALVVGLIGSFVFYQIVFCFIKPLGA